MLEHRVCAADIDRLVLTLSYDRLLAAAGSLTGEDIGTQRVLNIYIHFSDHDALMLVDVVNSGWAPIYNLNLSEDVPGYIQAPATALSYPSRHFIGGHLGRLATRDDIVLHQQYTADIEASAGKRPTRRGIS